MYVTGSSSKMLSTDVATEFRGRSLAYELLPLSFREYARYHSVEPEDERALYDKEQASVLKRAFKRYLVEGGFPGVQDLDDNERAQVLQTYAQLTVARDVVERYGFSNAAYVRNLARIALASSGRDFSISKVHNMGKSMGYSPGRAAITAMIEAFEDAHMLHGVYEYSHSAQKVRLGGFKLYAVDPGLFCALSPAANDGMAHALETAVYLELRRRSSSGRMGSISLLKLESGREVDFVDGDEAFGQAYALYQASYRMVDPATRKREVAALREAMARFGTGEGVIVTMDEEDEHVCEEGVVRIVPAWRWFMGGGSEG
jgi:predicted AAA+ superfamily ATPase